MNRETARKLFRYLLIRAREAAGKSGTEAAAALHLRQSAYAQYEIGVRRPDYAKLKLLLEFFGVPDRLGIMADVLDVARQSRDDGRYSLGLTGAVELYLALERYAQAIDVYESRVLHGLLQTPAYTRALHEGMMDLTAETDLDTMLAWRQGRQTVLDREPHPVRLTAYIDQAALGLMVGSREIMAEQLRSLLLRAKKSNIVLRVVPTPLVHHPTGGRQLAVLRFTDSWRCGYAETPISAYYYDSAAELEQCGKLVAHMHHVSLSPEESTALIYRTFQEMKGRPS